MLNSQRFAETRRLHLRCIMSNSTAAVPELKPSLSRDSCSGRGRVVLPRRSNACRVKLRLQNVPHEIVVVDDGSADATWTMLESLKARIPSLRPMQNPAPHGFGRAVACGFNHMKGDAVVVMIADESDDCRDVVRYWEKLNEGYDCVFGSRFVRGGVSLITLK